MRRFLWILAAAAVAAPVSLFPVLQSNARIGKQDSGFFLLPTSQLLQPWGEQIVVPGRPVDLAYDASRKLFAVLNNRGVDIFAVSSAAPVARIASKSTSYLGLAFRPGTEEVWASETTRSGPDTLLIADLTQLSAPKVERLKLDGHPVPCGIAFSPDGRTAYVALSRSNSVAIIDAASRKIVANIETGMAPFGIVSAPKAGRVFVSNRGGRKPLPTDTTAPSSGAEIATDPYTGATVSGVLTVIETETHATRELAVGLAPGAMALSPDGNSLAVANGNSDSVSLIDVRTLHRSDVAMPEYPEGSIGAQPIAVAFGDANTLYVGCAGTNSITVLKRNGAKWTAAGAIPTGWYPSAIGIEDDGALRVVNLKGTGNTLTPRGDYLSTAYQGSLSRLPVPNPAQLLSGRAMVAAANAPRFQPAGGVTNLDTLGIQHVFLIVKENRTYDQVLGDMHTGNGDPRLVMFGQDITPNTHAIAGNYVLLDNFHTGGAISFDGHPWLMQAFVGDYIERAFSASPRGYAWNMADALAVSPAGFFWQGSAKPPSLRIYGEFCEGAVWDPKTQLAKDINERDLKPWSHYWKAYQENRWQREVGSRSGVPALQRFIDPRYPQSDTEISDEIRASEFIRDFGELERKGAVPQLTLLTLTSDHTNGTSPNSPTPRAMVADGDLAMGRIIEAISKSRIWQNSLIFVVEDDAQDGRDHVDGHRTVALVLGPHVKRHAVDSNYYTHLSLVRTIQQILRVPPRSRFAAAARPMTSVFTAEADTRTYEPLQPRVAFDEMNPPVRKLTGRARRAALESLAMNFHEPDDVPAGKLNRIIWGSVKGFDTPYPAK